MYGLGASPLQKTSVLLQKSKANWIRSMSVIKEHSKENHLLIKNEPKLVFEPFIRKMDTALPCVSVQGPPWKDGLL